MTRRQRTNTKEKAGRRRLPPSPQRKGGRGPEGAGGRSPSALSRRPPALSPQPSAVGRWAPGPRGRGEQPPPVAGEVAA